VAVKVAATAVGVKHGVDIRILRIDPLPKHLWTTHHTLRTYLIISPSATPSSNPLHAPNKSTS